MTKSSAQTKRPIEKMAALIGDTPAPRSQGASSERPYDHRRHPGDPRIVGQEPTVPVRAHVAVALAEASRRPMHVNVRLL